MGGTGKVTLGAEGLRGELYVDDWRGEANLEINSSR